MEGHELTKQHKTSLIIASLISKELLEEGPSAINKVREAINLSKKAAILRPEQRDIAASCATISSSGIELARFQALRHSAVHPSDVCTEAERSMAASLIRMDQKSLALTHFLKSGGSIPNRQRALLNRGWCSPQQLSMAQQHNDNCTIKIQDTGLDRSRFLSLGIDIDCCTPEELLEAANLIDVMEHVKDFPLSNYDDYYDFDDQWRKRRRSKNKPIWISKKAYDAARSDDERREINSMTWAEICGIDSHPWDD